MVPVLHCGQPMRHDDDGAVVAEGGEGVLDRLLGLRVQGTKGKRG